RPDDTSSPEENQFEHSPTRRYAEHFRRRLTVLRLIICFSTRERFPSMIISEQIQKDMVDAMRSRDELRLSTLRMVKSALSYKEVEKRAPLDDKETQQI